MKKHIFTLLLSAAIVQTAIPHQTSAAAAAQTQTANIVQIVNFREQPSVSSGIIRLLKTGESLEVIDKPNAYWLKVKDASGRIGYVSSLSKYVRLGTASNGEQGFTDKPNAEVVRSVSFRKGPSTGADRIRYLKAGEKLLVLDKPNKYWYKVQDSRGTIGFVSTSPKYITTGYTEAYLKMDTRSAVNSVISTGMKYLGTPYEYASSRCDTKTFDCSDFVRQAFLEGIGLKLPADSRSQASFVKEKGNIHTDWRQLERGDLMFFMSYKGYKASDYSGINKQSQTVTHVGIYLGNGQVLHTYSAESGGVKINSISGNSWEYRFIFGGSAL